jgi:PPOX class probable F420-dependent enzyme
MREEIGGMSKNAPVEESENHFAPLQLSRIALLTTYRRNGQGVPTPVTIQLDGGKAYFTTRDSTGKVKRLARNPRVTLAPSTPRGQVIGPTVSGIARRLEGAEAERVMRGGGRWRKLWITVYRILAPSDRWISYEVTPLPEETVTTDIEAGRTVRCTENAPRLRRSPSGKHE